MCRRGGGGWHETGHHSSGQGPMFRKDAYTLWTYSLWTYSGTPSGRELRYSSSGLDDLQYMHIAIICCPNRPVRPAGRSRSTPCVLAYGTASRIPRMLKQSANHPPQKTASLCLRVLVRRQGPQGPPALESPGAASPPAHPGCCWLASSKPAPANRLTAML